MGLISAITETTFEMLPALGWAPDMPPRPDETNNMPRASVCPGAKRLRAAFITVMVVPWTMPCGPMYMYDPAVICPYCETPMAFMRSQSSGFE